MTKPHPYADLFPMMDSAELEALTADIAENGLRQPIVRYQGLILDGRNRLLACEKAGVEPTFTDHEGDDASALALVISLNVQRRDMTPAKRALVAARTWLANGHQKPGPKSIQSVPNSLDSLAKQFKASKTTISQARDLLIGASDLATQVESQTMSLAAAYEKLQERKKEAAQRERDIVRIAKYAEYAEAVRSGEMTWEEAMQKVIEKEREERKNAEEAAQARKLFFSTLSEIVKFSSYKKAR
jgi:hypothetical protein